MSSLDVNVCFLDAAEGKIYIASDRLCLFIGGIETIITERYQFSMFVYFCYFVFGGGDSGECI